MKAICLCVALLTVCLVAPVNGEAQSFPRRERGGSPRDSQQDRGQRAATSAAPEPYGALERELPSLNVDLRLTADQVDAWRVFERDVRDIAELDRARRRHLMALREGGEQPPTAVAMIATLVEEDRLKAEASGDLKRHLDALYAKLDDAQRLMLDRRVVLTQSEPLGK
jgi:hypothetical protein